MQFILLQKHVHNLSRRDQWGKLNFYFKAEIKRLINKGSLGSGTS